MRILSLILSWIRVPFFLIIIVLCLQLLSGGTVTAAELPVRIGGTLSLTGSYAPIAAYQRKAFRLWEKDVNARGGILGRPVVLEILDDHSDPETAVDLYRHLIVEEKVDLLVAPYSSDITEAILPLTAEQGYPIIASGASADRIWRHGYDHVFGLFLPAGRFAVGFFEMLVRYKVDRIALFSVDTSFAEDVAAGARTWAARFGLSVVRDERVPPGLKDYAGLARQARNAGAQVVFVSGYLDEAIRMRRAFRTTGWMPWAFYAPVGPGTEEYRNELGNDADGVFSTSQWEAFKGGRSRKDPFFAEYLRAYGQEPSYFAATAYASGQILEAAIRAVGTLDRAAIRKELASMEATSVIGRYGVDRTGVQIRNTNLVIQLQHERKEVVWPSAYRTAAPIFP